MTPIEQLLFAQQQQGLGGLNFGGLGAFTNTAGGLNSTSSSNTTNWTWGAVPILPLPPSVPLPDLNDPVVWLKQRVEEICWPPC